MARRPVRPRSQRSAGTGTLAVQSPWAIDPAFQVAHTWQINSQVERAFSRDFTASVGVMYAKGSQLPVVTNINPINPVGALADGRPIYSTSASAATRLDPRFNQILEVQSLGTSTFKSMTLQMSKRFGQGLSFNVQYSLGKGLDTTPLHRDARCQKPLRVSTACRCSCRNRKPTAPI